jgi:hypothetical protein
MIQTTLRNQLVYSAIAQQIVNDLLINATCQYDTIECHKYHEDMIFEREDNNFQDIWARIVNYEIAELYDNLEEYGRESVKQFVREVYPEWRESMN